MDASSPAPGDFKALLTAFTTRSEGLGVRVSAVASIDALADEVRQIAELWLAPGAVVAGQLLDMAPVLAASITAAGVEVARATSAEQCRDAPLGIGLGLAALAETGSVLVAEETLADRSVGMLTSGMVFICRSGDLLPGLDEAGPILRERSMAGGGRFVTLCTGPSRTADIERVLTVGVQGPGRVAVVFIDELE